MRRRGLLLAALLSCAATARAAPALRVSDCPATLSESLPTTVELEIDVLMRELGASSARPEEVTIRCDEDRAFIAVRLHGATRESNLDLAPLAPEHRARAVALAAAELVHSLSKHTDERAHPAPSTPPAAPPPAPRRLEPPPRSPAPRSTLAAGALAEWLGAPKTLLYGVRLALRTPLGDLVVPALTADGTSGGIAASAARVSVQTLTAAAHAYFGVSTSQLRWEAGPGARFGWARLSGDPERGSELEGRSLSAAWGGPELRARFAYERRQPWSPTFAVEVGSGVVVLPVRGRVDGTASVFALQGIWLSLSAQLGIAL